MHPVPSAHPFFHSPQTSADRATGAPLPAIVPQPAPRPLMQQSRQGPVTARQIIDPGTTVTRTQQERPGAHTAHTAHTADTADTADTMHTSRCAVPVSLHSAANAGELNLMRDLIRCGAPLDGLDSRGYTPLMDAAGTGRLDAVKLLLKKGARADATNNYGIQALHIAAYKGYSAIVEELIKTGQSVNAADRFGNKPLIDALKSRNAATVKALLVAGADPNVVAEKGLTPLMLAVELDDFSLLDLLLQNPHHNNIDAVGTHGKTALSLALRKGNPATVERLLNAGATVDGTCWPLVSDKITSDLLVHRHRLFRPDVAASLQPDDALQTRPLDCIKKTATLLQGAEPLQQILLNQALHGLGLSSFIVEALLRMATQARALAAALAGEGATPSTMQWTKIFVSMVRVAVADPALLNELHHQGLSPLTFSRMNSLVAAQINALQRAADLAEKETADNFKPAFIRTCLHLGMNEGALSGRDVFIFLISQGLHHELAMLLQQAATVAWERVNKSEAPIHLGSVLPRDVLGGAMGAMGQLLENELRAVLQTALSQNDIASWPGRHAAGTLTPAAVAVLTQRHQADLGLVVHAFLRQ